MELKKLICYSRFYLIVSLVLMGLLGFAQTSVWHGGRALWNDGTGTESDPYLIASADNLAFLAYMVNKGYETQGLYFRLVTDVDLNGIEGQSWMPIGLGDRLLNEDNCDRGIMNVGTSFRGHFDGGFHQIANINVTGGLTNAGLFGSVVGQEDAPAVIENVFVVSGSIHGKNSGGIAGSCNYTRVSRSCNGACVDGDNVGGLMGSSIDVAINNCFNKGIIAGVVDDLGDSPCAGGLVGVSQNNIQITNSYNVGVVSGGMNAQCFVGLLLDGTIEIENCHFLDSCAPSDYGTPQEDVYMRTIAFVDLLNSTNPEMVWAFDVNIINEGFPVLAVAVYSIEVQASPLEGGSVIGGGPLAYGALCTVSAMANDRYVFSNWMENEETVSDAVDYSFTVTGDRSIYAKFVLESYDITATSNPSDAGVIVGTGSYHFGDTVILIAIPNDNYAFYHWTINDSVVSDAETCVFPADHTCHLVADFVSCAIADDTQACLDVFPNPVRDFLFIRGKGIVGLTLFNLQGQIVEQRRTNSGQDLERIDFNNYENGTYIVKIDIANHSTFVKVLKQ